MTKPQRASPPAPVVGAAGRPRTGLRGRACCGKEGRAMVPRRHRAGHTVQPCQRRGHAWRQAVIPARAAAANSRLTSRPPTPVKSCHTTLAWLRSETVDHTQVPEHCVSCHNGVPVVGEEVPDAQLAARGRGRAMKLAISMWSGRTSCSEPPRLLSGRERSHVRIRSDRPPPPS